MLHIFENGVVNFNYTLTHSFNTKCIAKTVWLKAPILKTEHNKQMRQCNLLKSQFINITNSQTVIGVIFDANEFETFGVNIN